MCMKNSLGIYNNNSKTNHLTILTRVTVRKSNSGIIFETPAMNSNRENPNNSNLYFFPRFILQPKIEC
jgi:hypothetical protein